MANGFINNKIREKSFAKKLLPPIAVGHKGSKTHDSGYVFAPFVPIISSGSPAITGIGDNEFYMFNDSKSEVVEKLDKNLDAGWDHDAIRHAGRINDIENCDVYHHGSDGLCDVFGFTKEEYEAWVEEEKKKQAEFLTGKLKARWSVEAQEDLKNMHGVDITDVLSDAVCEEIQNEIDKDFLKNIEKYDNKIDENLYTYFGIDGGKDGGKD